MNDHKLGGPLKDFMECPLGEAAGRGHGLSLGPWSTRFEEPIKLPVASAYGCPRSGAGQNDHQRNEERRLNR
jgi:hypothetical protein